MPEHLSAVELLGYAVVAAPAVLVAVLGVSSLLDRKLSERATNRVVLSCLAAGLVAAVAVLALMLARDTQYVTVTLGDWVALHDADRPADRPVWHYSVKFVFDRLSVPLAILSFVLCGTIGAFAHKYMHREPGYNRFFALFAVFA